MRLPPSLPAPNMSFNFLHFGLAALRRSRVVQNVCVVLVCLIANGALATPGQLDFTFAVGGLYTQPDGMITAVAIQANGSIVVAGRCSGVPCISRHLSDGVLDTSFGTEGKVFSFPDNWTSASKLVIQPDQKVLLTGSCGTVERTDFCVARYLANGTPDVSFNGTGFVRVSIGDGHSQPGEMALSPDGKVLVSGGCWSAIHSSICGVRLSVDGTIDVNFGAGGMVLLEQSNSNTTGGGSVVTLSDGKYLLGGNCQSYFCVIRLDSSGVPDVTFGNGTTVFTSFGSGATAFKRIVVLPDGKFVAIGDCYLNLQAQFCLARYLADGQLDPSFGNSGRVVIQIASVVAYTTDATAEPDGRIIVIGYCSEGTGFDFCAARYVSDGNLDPTFGVDGIVRVDLSGRGDIAFAGVLQANGKLVLAGYVDNGNDSAIVRLKGGPYNPRTCALNADVNQLIGPTTDALLLTRYLLGLRGAALTDGAVGPNPGRSNAEIETYLADLLAQGKLDADGDGQSLAMTDGLLILRAMLGLTGDALTAGAVNTAHPNARNAQQILTWIESTHGVACLP